jgi:hypothetical protein
MLKDMKLSTILLLAVVGFLIYCLMKPTSEGFANQESKQETNSETNSETDSDIDSDDDDDVMPEMVSAKQMKKVQMSEMRPDSSLSEVTRVQTEADVSPEMVNQILADSEKRMAVGDNNVSGVSVYNYEANDEDVGLGASLDDAFNKAVPNGTNTDVIDLNRNNVKNYNAKDYLPKEVNDDWFNTDFSQAKYKMNDDKLINTERYVIGINTVGQSLKNASYDIRGAVNVPKYSVSPWNNSTIEPDYNIKPLC